MPKGRDWTYAEVRRLERLQSIEGMTVAKIGEELGRTERAVHEAIKAHGLGGNSWYLFRGVESERSVLDLLASEGPLRLRQIVGVTGLKEPTVCKLLGRAIKVGCAVKIRRGLYSIGPAWGEVRHRVT